MDDWQETLETALEDFENGKFERAKAYFEYLFEQSSDVKMLERVIDCQLKLGENRSELIQTIEEYRTFDLENSRLNLELATSYSATQRVDDATCILEEIIDRKNYSVQEGHNLMCIYILNELRAGRVDEAADWSDNAIEAFPKSVDCVYVRAQVRRAQGRYDEALSCLNIAYANTQKDWMKEGILSLMEDIREEQTNADEKEDDGSSIGVQFIDRKTGAVLTSDFKLPGETAGTPLESNEYKVH